jgi:hypothetical protein
MASPLDGGRAELDSLAGEHRRGVLRDGADAPRLGRAAVVGRGPKPVHTMGDVASPILQACPVGPDVHRSIKGAQASFWTLQLPKQLDIVCTWE